MQDPAPLDSTSRTTAVVALFPALTVILALLQAGLHAVDFVAPPRTELLELVFAIPWLLLASLLYFYTLPFVVALGVELGRGRRRLSRPALGFGVAAVVVQANFLFWPAYRVLGPDTFEEILFKPADLAVPVVAAAATVGYLRETDVLSAIPFWSG